jgi:hypothetical protein
MSCADDASCEKQQIVVWRNQMVAFSTVMARPGFDGIRLPIR